MAATILSSKWTGLNPSLVASIYAVTPQGEPDPKDAVEVRGPITDGAVELTANWQSPFEQSGLEPRLPFVTGLIQSGALESYVLAIYGKPNKDDNRIGSRIARETIDFSRNAQGSSGMTKLNSTQVFTGAAPVKLPLTMHFRAFDDPDAEVQAPLNKLAQWTLARELAPNGGLAQAVISAREGGSFLKVLLPSKAPQMVGLRFGGYTFAPLVLESVAHPLTVPRSSAGTALHVAVTLNLSSLSALDAADWLRARNGQPTQLFNN